MLRYGIPAYRMPPDLLEKEIDQIRVLGIPIHTNANVDSLETFRKSYDAVFIGLGTQSTRISPSRESNSPLSSAASTSCAPFAAASRCALGRGSWSSAAATSPSTWP